MGSESNEQRPQRHSREEKNLRQIEYLVQHQDQGKMKRSRKRQPKKTAFGGDCPGEE